VLAADKRIVESYLGVAREPVELIQRNVSS